MEHFLALLYRRAVLNSHVESRLSVLNGAADHRIAEGAIPAIGVCSVESVEQFRRRGEMGRNFAQAALVADVQLFGYVVTVAECVLRE
ncbi:MAG: hypothetical protein PHY16_17405 [Methylobacter sp.]|nr:hypothetical protein [Methylobacter sp.]